MDEIVPRPTPKPKRRWRRLGGAVAVVLLLVAAYPINAVLVHYADLRGWLPDFAESVDLPIEYALRGLAGLGIALGSDPLWLFAQETGADYESYCRTAERLALRHEQMAMIQERIDVVTDPREKAALQEALEKMRRREWR